MYFNDLAKKLKQFKIELNSMFQKFRLGLMGAQIGENVIFFGSVNTKFNGDPKKIIIGNNVIFAGNIDLRNRENGSIVIEDDCSFDEGLRLVAARESTIRIGKGTATGMMFVINAGGNVTLGQKCMISSYVHINGSAHPTYRDIMMMEQGYIQGTVEIGEDVWLANCTNVLMNTVIEKGVIASANSVVSGTIPEYSIVVGIPAKVVGQRMYKDESKNVSEDNNIEQLKIENLSSTAALESLNTLYKKLFYSDAPKPDAKLRRDGHLDSLNWLTWVEAIEGQFGIKLPAGVIQSTSVDSIEDFINVLIPTDETVEHIPLMLPEKKYHLYEQFEKIADTQRDKEILCVIQSQQEKKYSYAQLLDNVNQCAGYFSDKGLKAGQRLAIIYPTSIELISSFFAALKLGAIPSVHSFPSEKISIEHYIQSHKEIFNRMAPDMIFCDRELAQQIKDILDPNITIVYEIEQLDAPQSIATHQSELSDTAFIQHSSGTTGIQKGIALSHQAVSQQLIHYSKRIELNETDKIFSWLPLYHDMGLITSFLLPLLHGIPLSIMSPFEWINKPLSQLDIMIKHKSTLCWLPNFAFSVLTRRVSDEQLKQLDLSLIRKMISCSEPVSAKTMRAFEQKFQNSGLKANALSCCYAMAENTFAVTQSDGWNNITINLNELQSNKKAVVDPEGQSFVSQGTTIENNEMRIADSDSGNWLEENQVGSVYTKSDSMLNEYYKNPEANQNLFLDGYYNTGDLGFISNNELYITGRKKDLIIIGGRNFYPHDIEEIVGKFEEIKAGRTCAFGVEDEINGTEKIVVIAEKANDKINDSSELIAKIKESVFHELDCSITHLFIKDGGDIIKTSSGKISRSACREWFLNQ